MEKTFVHSSSAAFSEKITGLVTVPTGFDPATEKLPVIVFLHGMGERGDGSEKELERVKVHGIPKYFSADPDYRGLRVITLSPQCPVNRMWVHLTHPLMAWIKELVALLNGDEDRVSITGLSMGGYGTWDMLTMYPEMFSCAAPICGGGIGVLTMVMKKVKIRVFHGIDDPTVPFEESLDMVNAARKNGVDVQLTAYDGVGHASWVPAYEETDLIEWLASQVRQK